MVAEAPPPRPKRAAAEVAAGGGGGGGETGRGLQEKRSRRRERERERSRAVPGCQRDTSTRGASSARCDRPGQVSRQRRAFLFLFIVLVQGINKPLCTATRMRAEYARKGRARSLASSKLSSFRPIDRNREQNKKTHFHAGRASRGRPGAAPPRGGRRRGGRQPRRGQPGGRGCARRLRAWPFLLLEFRRRKKGEGGSEGEQVY